MSDREHLKLVNDIHKGICAEFGYSPVPVTFNKRLKRVYGRYFTFERRIELSYHGMQCNNWDVEFITNILKHETIHQKIKGHGWNFYFEAKRLGTPLTGSTIPDGMSKDRTDYKYKAVCPKCGHVHHMYRSTKKIKSCGHCSNSYNPNTILIWEKVR